MKILHVVQSYYPFQDKGGPVFKVRALAETMARQGHELTVLTADLGLVNHPEMAGELETCPWGQRVSRAGVEVIYLPTITHYRAMTVNSRVRKFCETRLGSFGLVHFFGLYDLIGPAVSYFARQQRIPYLVEPMGMYRPIDRNLWLKSLWHRTLGKRFLQSSARIVVTSEIEQQELLDAGFPPIRIVLRYNGIDHDVSAELPRRGLFRQKWNLPGNEPLLLFLSRLIPRKRADLLIDAFAAACPQTGQLVIAGPEGEPGYRAFLENCAKKAAVRERVVFTGPVYDQEKKMLYADADVFVLLSRYENFANVAAEAIACGVPVILTETCGISALVKQESAGLIVPAEKTAVSTAIRSLLGDSGSYKHLQEGCARLKTRLDWEELSAQMNACYEMVLAEAQS